MENTKYKSHSSFMLITVVICLRNEHVHAFVLQRFMHRNTSAPVGFPFFACDVLILKVLRSSLCTCNLCCYGISLSDFFMSFNVVGKTSFQGYTLCKWYKSNLLETVALQSTYISISLILSHIDSRHCAFALSYLYPITHSRHCVHK